MKRKLSFHESASGLRFSNWTNTSDSYYGYYQVRLWQRHGVVVGQEYRYISYDNVVWG